MESAELGLKKGTPVLESDRIEIGRHLSETREDTDAEGRSEGAFTAPPPATTEGAVALPDPKGFRQPVSITENKIRNERFFWFISALRRLG